MWNMLWLSAVVLVAAATTIHAAPASEDFFRGKVIRIIVGFSPCGGFDTYARTLSRYLGKYVPGSPSIIVQNMPGAGSLTALGLLSKATTCMPSP